MKTICAKAPLVVSASDCAAVWLFAARHNDVATVLRKPQRRVEFLCLTIGE